MSIFCIGQAAYDMTVSYSGPLVANGKYRVEQSNGCAGAPALNGACLCSLWGADAQLMARIGDDPYGALVHADLQRCGVKTDYLIPDASTTTSYSMIAVDDETGDRLIFNFPSKVHEAEPLLPSERPDVVLTDGHEAAAALAVLEAYPDVPSVVDAGTYREDTYETARAVDYVVCSEDFARQYTGSSLEDAEDYAKVDWLLSQIESINGGVAVITLGHRGLVFRNEKGDPQHMPAFKARAVDTTGAGDIFHGAFAFGLWQGLSLEENLRQCSMAAALSVQRMGGLSSIPTLEEVKRALISPPPYNH